METGYKVSDCMTIQPITISKDLLLIDCAKMMRDKHVGSLIVLDKGKLLGLVTEQDIVRKGVAELFDREKTIAGDVMVTELVTITPDKDIYDALKMMRDYNIRHLPVIDKGQMIGFLTIKDILKIQPQLYDLVVEKIELRESSRKPGFVSTEEGVCDGCGIYTLDLELVDGSMLCTACRNREGGDIEEEEDI